MFQVRASLINSFLACFDLTLTALTYLEVLRWKIGPAGPRPGWQSATSSEHILALGWVLILWLALLTYFAMYRSRRLDSPFSDLRVLAKVSLGSYLVLAGLAQVVPAFPPVPHFLFWFVAINFLVLSVARVGVRLVLRALRRRGYNTKNLLVVTSPEIGERLKAKIGRRAHYGYRILRHLVFRTTHNGDGNQDLEKFRQCLQFSRVDDVILALPAEARALTARVVDECENRGVNVRVVPDLFPLIQSDTQVYHLDGIPLVNIRLYPTEYFGYIVLKRLFDIGFSLAVLLLLIPLYVLIAALIKLTSPGPV